MGSNMVNRSDTNCCTPATDGYLSTRRAIIAKRESSGPNVFASCPKSPSLRCSGMCSNAAVKLSSKSAIPMMKSLFRFLKESASWGTTRAMVYPFVRKIHARSEEQYVVGEAYLINDMCRVVVALP